MSILTDVADGVYIITFNRVDKKNSFTNAMYDAFREALDQAENDAAVRAIVLKGHASIFSAGNDVEEFISVPLSGLDAPVFKLLKRISTCAKPIIAAVRGAAVGIGTTMLFHCEMVYASEKSKFSMPFTQLGVCPEAASSLIFPAMAGYHRAAEALLLGEMFDAQSAFQSGLVNRIVPDDEVEAFAMTQARKLATLPAKSIRTAKALMKSHLKNDIAAKLDEEAVLFAQMMKAPEAQEAFKAFLEKRKPDFSKFD